jgi:hypothetical protein
MFLESNQKRESREERRKPAEGINCVSVTLFHDPRVNAHISSVRSQRVSQDEKGTWSSNTRLRCGHFQSQEFWIDN